MTNEEKELMVVIMNAAVALVQTYNSGISTRAIKARMNRIADDLMCATTATKNG